MKGREKTERIVGGNQIIKMGADVNEIDGKHTIKRVRLSQKLFSLKDLIKLINL